MKNTSVRPMTDGQRKDINTTLMQGMPAEISFEDAENILKNKGALVKDVRHAIECYMPSALGSQQIQAWHKFYADHGASPDFSGLVIPTRQPAGFDRLLVVSKGMTPQGGYDLCGRLFKVWKWTGKSLDEVVDWQNDQRVPLGAAYAVWVRDRIEADEELKDISANDIKNRGILAETLIERELHEAIFFYEKKKHLDINNPTLCTGSRCRDGDVPSVGWSSCFSELGVRRFLPDNSSSILRSRQVVS